MAKHPASTVQILGAEKALFRALKTRRDTPKYGLIYHASLVGQTTAKNKGKISRMLAAKTALAIRYDALGEDTNAEMGVENRAKLEARLRFLEEKGVSGCISVLIDCVPSGDEDDLDVTVLKITCGFFVTTSSELGFSIQHFIHKARCSV